MNEAKESQVSEGGGEGANPASGRREVGEGRDEASPALPEQPGTLPRPAGVMKVVLKRVLIAAALLAACVAILAAVKAYGVWVLSGIAVVLFGLGLLRKDKKPSGDVDDRDAAGDRKEP
jgi:hypothetical protein